MPELSKQPLDLGQASVSGKAESDTAEKIAGLERRVATLAEKNARLSEGLAATRTRLKNLHSQLTTLAAPPLKRAVFLGCSQGRVVIDVNGSIYETTVLPELSPQEWEIGASILVNDALVVIAESDAPKTGELATVIEITSASRALVNLSAGSTICVQTPPQLQLEIGDSVVVDTRAGWILDRIVRHDVEQLLTPHIPDVQWSDIGGLGEQIEQIRDAIELPFSEPELYRQFALRPPRGVLLSGPPGCGKTLIAKAVARAIAQRKGGSGYFLSVKGPELLNKYVGETERHIRALFARARALAAPDHPVVIFFDEMEALFKTRGSGISSDVETLVVPQLLAELDGIETLGDVIVIGASNRQDMIDPAVLRPGRLDLQIQITRPDASQAAEILAVHLPAQTPVEDGVELAALRAEVIAEIYRKDQVNLLDTVTFAGEKLDVYVADLMSGAVLAGIVESAKKQAIKRYLRMRETAGSSKLGVNLDDFRAAIAQQRELLRQQVQRMDTASLALTLGQLRKAR